MADEKTNRRKFLGGLLAVPLATSAGESSRAQDLEAAKERIKAIQERTASLNR